MRLLITLLALNVSQGIILQLFSYYSCIGSHGHFFHAQGKADYHFQARKEFSSGPNWPRGPESFFPLPWGTLQGATGGGREVVWTSCVVQGGGLDDP